MFIGLEMTGKLAGFGTLDEIIRICQDIEGVYPVIDWAHAHARDQGRFKRVQDFEDLLREYEEFTTDFLHCHFSCIEYGERGERRHLEIEEKSPDFAKLATVLKKREYDITIISESPVRDKDSLKMKRILGFVAPWRVECFTWGVERAAQALEREEVKTPNPRSGKEGQRDFPENQVFFACKEHVESVLISDIPFSKDHGS
jgi:hypothetical protein